MNLWACDKSRSIKALLISLEQAGQLRRLAYSLDADPNRDAIRLDDTRIVGLTAYVYSFGQRDERYGVDLEFPPQPGLPRIADGYQDVTLARLMEMLAVHFDLA